MVENLITIMNKTVGGGAPSSVASSLGESGSAAAGGKGAAKLQKDTASSAKKLTSSNFLMKTAKKIGVSVGWGAFLKQSQVFTSTFGIFFQMVGAVADILLAPVMPIFLKAFKTMFDISMKLAPITAKLLIGIVSAIGMGVNALKGFLEGFDWWRNTGKPKIKEFLDMEWLDSFVILITSKQYWVDIFNRFGDWITGGLGGVAKGILKHTLGIDIDKISELIGGRDLTKSKLKSEQIAGYLDITAADLTKYAADPSNNYVGGKYQFHTNISIDTLDSIKMDQKMIKDMREPSEGFGGAGLADM